MENAPDEPDLALRLREGLRERPEAAITTTTDEGNIYSSAATFEELNLSPELLKVQAIGLLPETFGLVAALLWMRRV